MAVQRAFYFLVCFLTPVVRLQVAGYFGWTSSDGGHCWSNPGVTCSLQPSGCGPNQVNNQWGVGCNTEDDITLNRPTSQTPTTANGQPSNLGVDGNADTCASTTAMNPSWHVDLPGLHVVHGVRFKGGVYTNDQCTNGQIIIYVKSVAQGATTNQTECAQLSGTASCDGMETIHCGSVENPGNRLVIHYPGTGQLRVCELEIVGYQYPYNLAYGKPVMQDGTHASRYAYYAADGQLGTVLSNQDCTQTRVVHPYPSRPWWWVDLGSQNVVYSVRLLNIQDSGYYHRLRDFTIYVGDKNAPAEFSSNAVCHNHGSTSVGAAASVEFTCQNGPLLGRYVIVQLNYVGDDAYLQLCEVMVKGYKEKACSQRYGPDCSRQCDCPESHLYTCDYITGTCCGQYKKGSRCEQVLPHLTNAPTNESRTDTSIKVKWDAWDTTTGSGSATGVKYEVQYKPRGGSGTAIVPQQDTETNVTGLQKDAEYCFNVVVLDENNWRGEPSPESCFRTCGDPSGSNLHVTTNLDQGSKIHSNITITWNTLDYTCNSGRFELRVQQEMLSCDQISGTPLNTGSASSFTVSNKIPYTYYTVKFTVINNTGLRKDICKTIQTAEGVPSSPFSAAISSVSHNSLSVTWSKPNPANGIIVKYEIQYSLTGNETHSVKTVVDVEGDEITSEISNLSPRKQYSVQVRAFTSVGPGSWSETLYAVTAVGKPDEPKNLRNTSRGHTHIVFEWDPPDIKNGQITAYEVMCEPGNIDEYIFGEKTILNVTGLTSSTLYSCKVKAATSAGLGKDSRLVPVWTKPKIDLQTVKETTNKILSKTDTSITVKLVQIPNVDIYRVLVENATDNMRSKRDVAEFSVFPETNQQRLTGYYDAQRAGLSYYITAEMSNPPDTFTVGDGKAYGGYRNEELVPGEKYNVYYGGKKTTDGETDEAYILIIGNEIAEPGEETINMSVIGGVVGGVALILIIAIVAIVILRRKKLCPFAANDNPSNVNMDNNQDLKLTNLPKDPNKEGIYEEIPDPDKHVEDTSYTKLSRNTKAPAGKSLYTGINSGSSGVYVNDSAVSGVYVNDV